MKKLNEEVSINFDYSFCIEKEISRHNLYSATEKIIEIAIKDSATQEGAIDTLTLWLQNISRQLLYDIQKFLIMNKLLNNLNITIEKPFIEKLTNSFLVGYKSVYNLKGKIEQYQKQKGIQCHHLNFILSGLSQNYCDFLISLDVNLIKNIKDIEKGEVESEVESESEVEIERPVKPRINRFFF